MIVRIRDQAEKELEAAFDWYEDRSTGLGHDFLNEYVRATHQIAESPNRWPTEAGFTDVHRYRINRFPFVLIYRVEDEHCMIVAVMHSKQKPGYWRNRLDP